MKIICENGFFKFYPQSYNQVNQFIDTFGKEIVPMGDFYTFPALAGLPDYSIEGQLFGGVKAKINYASTPWEVFKQNGLNYNLDTDTIESSDAQVNIVGESADNYNWVVTGIPPAFAQLSDKTKISGFQGFIDVVRNYTIVTRWENADI